MHPSSYISVAALLALASPGSAHGDLHRKLAELTAAIVKNPRSPGLYLRRGELHRLHKDWAAARKDLDALRELSPGFPELDFHAGRLEFHAGRLQQAKRLLDAHLVACPRHFRGHFCRARLLTRMGESAAALRDYDVAVALEPENPDHYLERARVQRQSGVAPRRIVKHLDAAVQRLGDLVVLHETALQVELEQRAWPAARRRLDRLIETMPLAAPWLLRRGMVLERMGDLEAARHSYTRGLRELADLPRRNNIQLDFQRSLESRLRRLDARARAGKDNPPPSPKPAKAGATQRSGKDSATSSPTRRSRG